MKNVIEKYYLAHTGLIKISSHINLFMFYGGDLLGAVCGVYFNA
jgi:hypothetical protein